MIERHVLLLHGALGSAAQLDALAERVRAELGPSVSLHAPDFEGHGDAASVARPYRIRHFAENVLSLFEREGITRANVFGYSMGGYVALHLAAQGCERIERVATLGTKFRWDPATAEREAARLDPQKIRAKVPRFAETLAARHERAGGWEAVVAGTADCLRDLGAHPLLDREILARIMVPVRVMVGDRDATVTVEEAAEVSRAMPNAELAVLPRTPHPLEQVDLGKLVPLLADFLAAPTGD